MSLRAVPGRLASTMLLLATMRLSAGAMSVLSCGFPLFGCARTPPAAQRYLENLGVARDKTTVVSFGSQRPKAREHDEASWAQNRRGDVMVQ
jgi:hypothetical protein